jgi:hypothetical protein
VAVAVESMSLIAGANVAAASKAIQASGAGRKPPRAVGAAVMCRLRLGAARKRHLAAVEARMVVARLVAAMPAIVVEELPIVAAPVPQIAAEVVQIAEVVVRPIAAAEEPRIEEVAAPIVAVVVLQIAVVAVETAVVEEVRTVAGVVEGPIVEAVGVVEIEVDVATTPRKRSRCSNVFRRRPQIEIPGRRRNCDGQFPARPRLEVSNRIAATLLLRTPSVPCVNSCSHKPEGSRPVGARRP